VDQAAFTRERLVKASLSVHSRLLVTAALMVLVSLTGLVLIFFLQKRLTTGLAALTIGTVACFAVYLIWVS